MNLLTVLRELRRQRKLPIVELSYYAGLDDGTMSKCERGFKKVPEKAQVRIATFMGVKQEELFDELGFAKKE
jgi:hypothetical protein